MNKLNYGSYDPSNADIAYSATNGYEDPASELETRKQLSYPLKEAKDFINNTVTEKDGDAVQLVLDENDVLKYRTTPTGELNDVHTEETHGIPSGGTTGQVLQKTSNTDFAASWKDRTIDVLTTAPAAAYTGGGYKVVYLNSAPATKYDGYIYLIKES